MYRIYVITNTCTGLQYVGMTCQEVRQRWYKHCTPRVKSFLNSAIQEYGKDNFTIQVVAEHEDLLDAMIDELLHIKELKTQYPQGYNRMYSKEAKELTASKIRGRKHSKETVEKIKEARARQTFSPEVLEKRATSIRNTLNKSIECSNGQTYTSVKEAATELNMPLSSISRVLTGYTKNPKHGLLFWYKEAI